MFKVIILIIFCLIAFYYGWWSKTASNSIKELVNIECENGVCPMPEDYKDGEL